MLGNNATPCGSEDVADEKNIHSAARVSGSGESTTSTSLIDPLVQGGSPPSAFRLLLYLVGTELAHQRIKPSRTPIKLSIGSILGRLSRKPSRNRSTSEYQKERCYASVFALFPQLNAPYARPANPPHEAPGPQSHRAIPPRLSAIREDSRSTSCLGCLPWP